MLHRQLPSHFWFNLIGHSSERARMAAILHLSHQIPESDDVWGEIVPLLVRLLKTDPSVEVRKEAICGFSEIGPAANGAVAALIEAARDPDEEMRWHAVVALRRIGGPAATSLPVFVKALSEPNPGLRIHAIQAIAALGHDAIVNALESAGWPPGTWSQAQRCDSAYVRQLVALARVAAGQGGSAALTDLLSDAAPEIRRAAAAGLVLMGVEAARCLDAALRHPDAAVRIFAVAALGKFWPEAERPLRAMLDDPDEDVRYIAGRTIRFLRPASS
jgi:HEAT repeat protein